MIRLDQPDLKTIEHLSQQLPNCISFAQGALRIGGVDQAIHAYAQSILDTDKADYYAHSLGIAALRQKLSQTLSAQFNANVDFENVIVTHGSINGIAALCLLLLDFGDEVLLPEPTYPSFVNAITLSKAQIKHIGAYKQIKQADGTVRWVLDLDMVKASRTHKTKMLILAHPSNPCGVCLTQEELAEVAAWCEEQGIYCIFDEAYENYFFDGPTTSSTALVPQSKFLVRTGSFSKTFGMSGWRVGYVVAPKHIIDHLAAVQDGLIVCPNVIAQYAALYALDHPEIAASYTNYIKVNRDFAFNALHPLVQENIVSCIKPPAGFFLFVQTHEKNTLHLAHELVKHAGVAVVPGKDFGPSGHSFVRLCYARKTELLKDGLERLVTYMHQHVRNGIRSAFTEKIL